jgi:L-alanine-DL-glutamate epimerase-like enolase superfamily enzyme
MPHNASNLSLAYFYQQWPMRKVFRISRETQDRSPTHVVHVSDGQHIGRGECGELRHYGESRQSIEATFETMRLRLPECPTPELFNAAFAAGSARNAVDCALWDLACKRSGKSIWQLTGIAQQPRLEIDFTIGIDDVEDMCRSAAQLATFGYRELKIKVDAASALRTVSAIAQAAPGTRLLVDANEAWTLEQLQELVEPLQKLNVTMIEQPLRRQDDHQLEGFSSPIPLYADESFATSADLDRMRKRYNGVNIKLDKCGGLTEALKIVSGARERGLGVMIGCAGATSLGLAPAYVVGTLCNFRDLDSAGLHFDDRSAGMLYRGGNIGCFTPSLWG